MANPFGTLDFAPGYGPRPISARQPTPTGYTLDPRPQFGAGEHGSVPGLLGLPDPLADLGRAGVDTVPLNRAATAAISTGLQGELDPNDVMAIQDEMARFGVASGMPGSGLAINRYLGNVLGAREQRRQQAFQNYGQFVPTVTGTQTVAPGLQNEIALQNALNAAAPTPGLAASYAERLFNNYLNMLSRNSGGPAGGTSRSASPRPSSGGGGFQFTGTPAAAPERPLGIPNPFYGAEPGDVPYNWGVDPSQTVGSANLYQSPGDVPYWMDVDPTDYAIESF